MSRAYRPRLSKDKAVAQRVGEALERERVERFSVAKQIAAFKSLEDSSNSQTSEETSKVAGASACASRRARVIAAAKPTPAADRQRAPSAAAEIPSENNNGDGKTVVPRTKTAPPDPGMAAHDNSQRTRRAAASSTDTPASSGGDTKRGWPCPSCSFLNRETASQCSMCSTRHFRPASATSRKASSNKVRNSSTLSNGEH